MIITAKNRNRKIFLKRVKYLKHSLIKVIQLFWNKKLSDGVDYHKLVYKPNWYAYRFQHIQKTI